MHLELSIEEVNQVLQALGMQPFEQVYALIQKIHQQAGSQAAPLQEGTHHE